MTTNGNAPGRNGGSAHAANTLGMPARSHYMTAQEASGGTPRTSSSVPAEPTHDPTPALKLAFAPLHKRAFGTAIGVAAALVIFVLTVYQLTLAPPWAPNIGLLAQYFRGYQESWGGAFVGMLWGFGVGFIAGWFFAFCRNVAIATSVFIWRTKAELGMTRDFLDHI